MKAHAWPFLLSGALSSCTVVGPPYTPPHPEAGSTWKQGNGHRDAPVTNDWWKLYADAALNKLINQAFTANQDLAAAKARIDTARALIGLDRARFFPTLDLTASAQSSRTAADTAGGTPDLTTQRYRRGWELAFDPDLWGRNQRALQASQATASQQQALYDAQRLGVALEVARQYFILRGLDAQEAVLKDTLKSRRDALSLQSARSKAGLTDGLTASRASTETELATNDLAAVQRQRGSAEHALAVLCGAAPSAFTISPRESSRPLPSITPGLPADVLRRRPDVRAAELALRAANAKIGVAEAAFYPHFSLTTSGGFEALDVKRFLDWENRVLSIGLGLAAPLIDGGKNKANRAAAQSAYEEALANYRQTWLIALREVEDALLDLQSLSLSRAALARALTSSQDTKQLAQERFDKGLTSYLEVVDAQRSTLQIRLSLAQLTAQQHITLALLAKSLGGT